MPIIIAAAGVKRLSLADKIVQYFEVDEFIPAVCQGILALQMRADAEIKYLIENVHCEETALCAIAERAYLTRLNGGCSTPIAAHAVIFGERMTIKGMLADYDRKTIYRSAIEGDKLEAAMLGEKLADLVGIQTGGNVDGG